MNVKYKETIPEAKEYFNLFLSTGWNKQYKADQQELYNSLANSWHSLSAYNQHKELIGFGRIVSDGVLYAFICDMIIKPNDQKKGIGTIILNKLIQKCEGANIRIIWLFAASNKSEFYKKFGFLERPQNAPGMQLSLFKKRLQEYK